MNTPHFTETEGERAFQLHSTVVENESKRRQLLASNAKILAELKDLGLYKAILGDDRGPWSGYLGQLEVMYSRNQINTLILIYKGLERLGVDLEQVQDISHSRLVDIVAVARHATVGEWIDKARVLTSLDWSDEIRLVKGRPTSTDCKHKFQNYEICKECGFKHAVTEIHG